MKKGTQERGPYYVISPQSFANYRLLVENRIIVSPHGVFEPVMVVVFIATITVTAHSIFSFACT